MTGRSRRPPTGLIAEGPSAYWPPAGPSPADWDGLVGPGPQAHQRPEDRRPARDGAPAPDREASYREAADQQAAYQKAAYRGPAHPGAARPRAGRPPVRTTLLSGPQPAYRPGPPRHRAPGGGAASRRGAGSHDDAGGRADAAAAARVRAAPGYGYPLSDRARILGWLPFGGRLVLLPKDAVPGPAEGERGSGDGWLRPAVFGAMDGLVTNASLIAGIGGGGGDRGMIVVTGIAGLIAGAFSMATGEYISVSSQNELTAARVEAERAEHAVDPAGKLARMAQIFVEKGVSADLAEEVAWEISADPDRAVDTHVREDLGIDPRDLPSPRTAALASLASFTAGALVPLSPFLLGFSALGPALALAGAAAYAGGAAVARLTGRSVPLGGLRQFTAAFLGTGVAFLIGHLIS